MAEVTNSFDEAVSIFFWCACLNSMTQVHYMSSRTGLSQNFFSAFLNSVVVCHQNTRVQVTLNATTSFKASSLTSIGNAFASHCHVDSPVQTHDVRSSSCHALDQSTRVLDVNSSWYVWVVCFDLFVK
jgi:hypothetical protein